MPDLSSNSRKILLGLAREAIRNYLETGDHLVFQNPDEELTRRRGCFVTLRKERRLRGCVGTFDASRPLCENVIRMAAASAFQDTRFPNVAKAELPVIRIEISVLGGLEKVDSLEEIELGRHGVLVKLGKRTGTFLPEVALEHQWSREEFVTFCAREKAGLRPDECAAAEIYRYEVEKFGE